MKTKTCSKCKINKEEINFRRNQCQDCVNAYHRKYYIKHREKISQRTLLYQRINKDKRRKFRLKRLYSLTENQFDQLLEEQNGVCYICEERPKKICVDHDHRTGKVRGLLCDNCNKALGLLKDNIERLEKAVQYLKRGTTSKS